MTNPTISISIIDGEQQLLLDGQLYLLELFLSTFKKDANFKNDFSGLPNQDNLSGPDNQTLEAEPCHDQTIAS